MRIVLLYPPLTDPTSPYHSLTYLRSHASAQGFTDITIRDANIEAFHHSLRPERFAAVVAEVRARRDRLLAANRLTDEQSAHLAALLAVDLADRPALLDAIDVLRDPERFYDYEQYRRAIGRVQSWMTILSGLGSPGQFHGFDFAGATGLNLSASKDLTDPAVLATVNAPYQAYYDQVLVPELLGGVDLVGVNITYTAQLPFALGLARTLRRAAPDLPLVAGGTEVSDVWKYADRPETFDRVFAEYDATVVGEGESAFLTLLSARQRGAWPNDASVRLAARHRAPDAAPAAPTLSIERLASLATPDYDGLPWDLYLSPHRFVYYSPTRGCYWNRCTFCDYGLNGDGPTSPWRQDPVTRVVEQVAQISAQSQFVYFSVDVLAPATMLRFAEAVVEHGIDVRWGAEIRLEKYWSPERCNLLRRSGCVAVSVGFESGNDRVLGLIDKGVTVEQTRRTVANLAAAGIAVQMMGFTGFPGETASEANDSISFLRGIRDQWTFGGLGSFDLTAGAIVAKHPERFGITGVAPQPGTDIHRILRYDSPVRWSDQERSTVRQGKLALAANEFDRPWVGGTDTPHSYFYHARYGTDVLRVITARDRSSDPGRRYRLNGVLVGLGPEWTVDGFPATAQPRIRHAQPGEERHVPFVRRDGAVFALPQRLAQGLARYERHGLRTGVDGLPAWAERAAAADVLAADPMPVAAGTRRIESAAAR